MVLVKPVVKWVGGKKRLENVILENTPKEFNSYFEPFVGGGAIMLNQDPIKHKIIINDFNKDLVNLYKHIKKNPKKFIKKIEKIKQIYIKSKNKKIQFYLLRARFNNFLKKPNSIDRAALFLFMNKSSFNGIMSINSDGISNASWGGGGGKYPIPGMYVEENVMNFSKFLKKVTIKNQDYEKATRTAKRGDFVYLDPPYVPDDITKCNVRYLKNQWTMKDFKRTFDVFDKLAARGCFVMFSNSWSNTVVKRFSNKKKYRILKVPVNRMVSRDKNTRGIKYEALVMNYPKPN